MIKANLYLYWMSRQDDIVWLGIEKLYCFPIMLFWCLTDTHYFEAITKKCVLIIVINTALLTEFTLLQISYRKKTIFIEKKNINISCWMSILHQCKTFFVKMLSMQTNFYLHMLTLSSIADPMSNTIILYLALHHGRY